MFTHSPGFLTIAWLFFCLCWALRSLVVRRRKAYAIGRKRFDVNRRYKVVSTLVYVLQVVAVVPIFWFQHPLLLTFTNQFEVRLIGLILCFLGLLLSVWSLRTLGRNYSPCFDSHEPFELITEGPYRYLRHPGWLSKLIAGFGGFLVSGSWWFFLPLIWIVIELRRTISVEETMLENRFPHYEAYCRSTPKIFPFFY